MRSSRSRTGPGKSPRIGLSPHGRGLRAMTASMAAGSACVSGERPHPRSRVAVRPPSWSRNSIRGDPRAGLQAHGMPFRAGEVPVRVDRHGPGAVCLHRTPLDRVERGGRQREHMLLLRFEQAGDGHAEPVMVGLREPCVCSIGSGPVEHLELVHVSGWF